MCSTYRLTSPLFLSVSCQDGENGARYDSNMYPPVNGQPWSNHSRSSRTGRLHLNPPHQNYFCIRPFWEAYECVGLQKSILQLLKVNPRAVAAFIAIYRQLPTMLYFPDATRDWTDRTATTHLSLRDLFQSGHWVFPSGLK